MASNARKYINNREELIWDQFSFASKSEATRRTVSFVFRFEAENEWARKKERERERRKEKKDSRSNIRLINNASSVAFNCTSNEQILYFFF